MSTGSVAEPILGKFRKTAFGWSALFRRAGPFIYYRIDDDTGSSFGYCWNAKN